MKCKSKALKHLNPKSSDTEATNEVYLILFKDGCFQTSTNIPVKSHYQEGARFFRLPGEMPVVWITRWIADSYELDDRPYFIEIPGRD